MGATLSRLFMRGDSYLMKLLAAPFHSSITTSSYELCATLDSDIHANIGTHFGARVDDVTRARRAKMPTMRAIFRHIFAAATERQKLRAGPHYHFEYA